MRHLRFLASAGLAVAICAMPLRAEADGAKAWAAAKANLPATTSIVVGVDLGAITSSSLFGQLFPLLLQQRADVKFGFDLVKTACKIDPMSAIDGVVVGSDATQSEGALFVAVNGLDPQKIAACLEQIARANGSKDAKVAVKRTGAITELALGADTAYIGWVGRDVLVIPLDAKSKAQLGKWMGHKGALARSPVGRALARTDTTAALWGASAVPKTLEQGIHMKLGYGALRIANGTLATDLRVALETAASASEVVSRANDEIGKLVAGGALPTDLQAMLKGISVTASGAEVVVKASVLEKDLLALLATFLRP